MTLSTKILIWLGAILVAAALIFIIVKQVENGKRQTAIESEITLQKQLADNILRAQKEWATKKDIEDFAKSNGVDLKVVQNDLDKLNAKVDGINVVVAKSAEQKFTNISSTGTIPGNPGTGPTVDCNGAQLPCPDPYGYQHNTQQLRLDEKFSNVNVPVGQVGFSSWKDKPWDVTVYPRTYTTTTVLGKDENGKEYAYNKMQIESNGEKFEVKLDNSRFLQEYPTPSFSFWNPRLYLGISGGMNAQQLNADAVPSLSLAFMSYGQFKAQPAWTFLGLGAGYAMNNQKINFLVTPVSYNVGQHIPLTRNIYVGPSIAFDTLGGVYFLGTLNVGL